MRDIRVATVQFQHLPGDRAANLDRVRAFAGEAAGAGAEIVVFPEMCITGYWHVRRLSRAAVEDLSEPVPDGPISRELLVGLTRAILASLVFRAAEMAGLPLAFVAAPYPPSLMFANSSIIFSRWAGAISPWNLVPSRNLAMSSVNPSSFANSDSDSL